VTRAQLLAALSAAAGVAGAWEALAAIERARAAAWFGAAVRPLARSRAEGRAPTAPERRRLALLAAAAVLAAGWLLAGPLLALLGAIAAPATLRAIVGGRRRAYRARLAADAAPAARALAAALSAGRAVRGAVAEAAGGLEGPAGVELRRTAGALAAGEPTERALEGLRARAGSRAWDTLVAAVLLQRDAGGDLPGLLRDLAGSLEAAERAEGDAQAATAQARFTARLVAGLPLLALGFAELGSPGFVGGMLASPVSLVLLVLAALLQAVGLLAVRGITKALAAP
jgi:tight adherence protein B